MKITRDTIRADGLTVGEAIDQDAADLRSLGFDAKAGALTVDERREEFQAKVRQAVLDALDSCVSSGKGWSDADLPRLFAAIDPQADKLFDGGVGP